MNSSDSFIPYGRQNITEDDICAVTDILRSPYLTQGPAVPAFEQAVSTIVGSNYAVAVNSATSALHIACLALGLGPGDWLWTSPTTFVASANCARYCGANVDFVDIDPSSGLISVLALKEKLVQAEKSGRLPKIVVPVHLCGSSCKMDDIAELADRYGFFILEDASHAIGGSFKDKPVGSCEYSSICVFSFHPVKIITSGEGGMAVTNDPTLAQRMQDLRSHGITKDQTRFSFKSQGPWYYEQHLLGFNYRMTDIQAALGLSQLNRLHSIIQERHEIFNRYKKFLKDFPLVFLSCHKEVFSSLHLAVIRLDSNNSFYHLNVFQGLRTYNIGVQLHYLPVHLQPYYRSLGFSEGDFPEAEAYACNAISLPIYEGFCQSSQLRVVEALDNLL